MDKLKIVLNSSDESVSLHTDGCGNWSLKVCGYLVNSSEDAETGYVSVLLSNLEMHELLVRMKVLFEQHNEE